MVTWIFFSKSKVDFAQMLRYSCPPRLSMLLWSLKIIFVLIFIFWCDLDPIFTYIKTADTKLGNYILKTTMLDCKQTDSLYGVLLPFPTLKGPSGGGLGTWPGRLPGQTWPLPGQLSQVHPVGRRFQGRHRECRKDYISVEAKIPW